MISDVILWFLSEEPKWTESSVTEYAWCAVCPGDNRAGTEPGLAWFCLLQIKKLTVTEVLVLDGFGQTVIKSVGSVFDRM